MKWCDSWKRIVLVPMDRVGDAISDTPALSFLRSRGIEVIVLATTYTAQIFENNPNVYKCLTFSRIRRDGIVASAVKSHSVVKELQSYDPHAVIGMMRQIRELRQIFTKLSIPVVNKPQDNSLPIYLRWVEFFKKLGLDVRPARNEIYPSDQDREAVISWAQDNGIDLTKPFIVVHPGCAVYKDEKCITNSLRCWPLDNYQKIFSNLPKDVQIVLTGIHPSEREANSYIRKQSPLVSALFDVPNLRALAWLIERSRLLITLDTGTLHIGAATDTPIIALFGPSDPAKYGPWGKNITYVRTDECLNCWPCDQKAICGGQNTCMKSLLPEKVSSKIREIFHEPHSV
ncbi:MAG TPA: glycosyltransferase family 9 protein [Deltaproteobacteria bacterium]|nr:glycosyltransferase family 9 protein [Deltaproteobacteria bacterium]HQI01838.1 glycosyltransferase family 9 protein [Deltaproteobacteria bacterium]